MIKQKEVTPEEYSKILDKVIRDLHWEIGDKLIQMVEHISQFKPVEKKNAKKRQD